MSASTAADVVAALTDIRHTAWVDSAPALVGPALHAPQCACGWLGRWHSPDEHADADDPDAAAEAAAGAQGKAHAVTAAANARRAARRRGETA